MVRRSFRKWSGSGVIWRFPRIIPEILVVVPSRADVIDDALDTAKDGYQKAKDVVQGNETQPVPLPEQLPETTGNDTDRPLLNFDNTNRNGNLYSSRQSLNTG